MNIPLPQPTLKSGQQMCYDGYDKAFFDCFDPRQMIEYGKSCREAALEEAFAAIPSDRPIILFPKIGNGDSRMHKLAPLCWAYMMNHLNAIKAEYRYDYYARYPLA